MAIHSAIQIHEPERIWHPLWCLHICQGVQISSRNAIPSIRLEKYPSCNHKLGGRFSTLNNNYDYERITVSKVQWRDGPRICAGLFSFSDLCRELACRPAKEIVLARDENALC